MRRRKRRITSVLVLAVAGCAGLGLGLGGGAEIRGWKKGKGWGWIWGKDDEVGALNAMTDASRLAALALVKHGKVYDLGVPYDRSSFKWPGHSPGEVITFRSPEGVKRQGDIAVARGDLSGSGWHSCALFISDNVGTQIDGLGHVTLGADNHWYNGYAEAEHGGDFGIRRCDAIKIPPIINPAVLIDVAGWKKVDSLPAHYAIGAADLRSALEWQKTDIEPGDVVLIRTGTLRHWGESGADQEVLKEADTAGINLEAARWLIEEKGALFVGGDTSGLEVTPPPEGSKSFMPAHLYLLVEQGVHIGELHNLEALARDRVYRFCYIALVNKIRGAVAGFTLRPVALH
jgi:kynurenine formamidase